MKKLILFNGHRRERRYWHVAIARNRYRGRYALLMYRTEQSMHKAYKTHRIMEYRRCNGFLEAYSMVRIYNH